MTLSTEHRQHWDHWAAVVGTALRNLSLLAPRPAEAAPPAVPAPAA
ncbi:hypothetical protein [Kitasatospora sp. NPDC001683]